MKIMQQVEIYNGVKLSIIIPVYNEAKTILDIFNRVTAVDFGMEREIIVIDDGSNDDTARLLKSEIRNPKSETNSKIRVIFQDKNQGKGAAIRRGFQEAVGEIIIIQDADLEYAPNELPGLLKPILDGRSDIVYGSRFLKKIHHRYFLFYLGNRLISFLYKIFYNAKITDPMTCYKIFKRSTLSHFTLKANRFEIDSELTSNFLKAGYKILELPISYQGRTFQEGKKINWKDGLKSLLTILKIRFGF